MHKVMASAPAKAMFLLGAVAMVWFVPYLVPVAPSIALSYVVGYNNRAAVALFLLAALTFAYLPRGVLARVEDDGRDQPMRTLDLVVGLALVLLALIARHHHVQAPKAESAYAINRLQMLAAGLRPYTGFEYVYGPLQLYVPLLLSRVLRMPIQNAYYVWWYGQWLVGTWMAWMMVKLLPGELRWRRFIFPFVLLTQYYNILAEGTAYTPVRMIGAAFWVLVVCACGRRTRNPVVLLGAVIAAMLFEFGVSPEQGIAVGLGLLGWLTLKAYRERTGTAMGLAGGTAVSFGLICVWFNWLGVFAAVREFGGGAYCFPLLPSVAVAVVLLAYVAAACAGMRAWLADDFEGPAIAMALCGLAAVPAAFGRCDTGHLQLGSAAVFLGLASIETMPGLRRVWTPLLVFLLVALPVFFTVEGGVVKVLHKMSHPAPLAPKVAAGPVADDRELPLLFSAPCVVIYRVPALWPNYSQTAAQQCLDTGYFAGMLDVLTPATIDRKVREITAEPRRPLLLRAEPLAQQFGLQVTEVNPEVMRGAEQAFYVPPVRHKTLDYGPVMRAIEDHYTPGPLVAGGMQVWEPKGATER